MLAPATLAALPSTRAIPDRDVFYVAHPVHSILKFRHLTSDLRPLNSHLSHRSFNEGGTLNSQLAFRVSDSLPSLEGAENQVTFVGVPSQVLAVAISDALAAAGRNSLIKQLQLNRFGCAVG